MSERQPAARRSPSGRAQSRRIPILIGIYVAPAVLVAASWTHQPLALRIELVAESGCGPLLLAFLLLLPIVMPEILMHDFPTEVVIARSAYALLALVAAAWLTVLWKTRMRNLPYRVHLMLAIGWWLIGTLIIAVGLGV